MRAFQHAPAFGFRFQHASGLRPSLVSISAFPLRARPVAPEVLLSTADGFYAHGEAMGRLADKARSAVLTSFLLRS